MGITIFNLVIGVTNLILALATTKKQNRFKSLNYFVAGLCIASGLIGLSKLI
jgi:hypothetical protein